MDQKRIGVVVAGADSATVLAGIEKPLDAIVAAGDTLGWIEPGEVLAEDET